MPLTKGIFVCIFLAAEQGRLFMAKAAVKRRKRGSKTNYKALAIKAKEIIVKEQGVVGQIKGRKWAVLLNKDGTKKAGIEVLPPKRRKRRSAKRKASKRAIKSATHAVPKEAAEGDKFKLLTSLAAAIGGPSAKTLYEIAEDLREFSKLKNALKSISV
jgi:hypothetical protein